MNDFTKAELNILADGIVLIKTKCKTSEDDFRRLDLLDEKLCSMINNYCEHDACECMWDYVCPTEQGCCR